MRSFEEDFDFDSDYFENDARVIKTQGKRIDSYPTVIGDKTEHSDDDERKARIAAHTERVQSEMETLGLIPGYKRWERDST